MHYDIENSEDLAPHLQRMVDHGVNGLDIMHGELKNLMLMADARFTEAQEQKGGPPAADYSAPKTRSHVAASRAFSSSKV